jgi:hypothetical protein
MRDSAKKLDFRKKGMQQKDFNDHTTYPFTLYFLCSFSVICIHHTSPSWLPVEISYLHVLPTGAEIDGILPE